MAFGPADELYVADANNGAIRRIDAHGVTTTAQGLAWVTGVAAAPDGSVYFSTIGAGQMAGRIGVVRKGQVSILVDGTGPSGTTYVGPAGQIRIHPGEGMIVDGDRLLFADTENNRVRSLSLHAPYVLSTVFGDGNAPNDAQDSTRAWLPRGLAKLNGGYAIADFAGYRIVWWSD
jgi:hypothetical protein